MDWQLSLTSGVSHTLKQRKMFMNDSIAILKSRVVFMSYVEIDRIKL